MQFSGSDKDVINHPDVEAVWICSPSQFHTEQIRACADAGKHIFCEKPLATDLKGSIEAVNYCRTKGVKLMTALQRRFDPNFVRIKKARAAARSCRAVAGLPRASQMTQIRGSTKGATSLQHSDGPCDGTPLGACKPRSNWKRSAKRKRSSSSYVSFLHTSYT